jgi:hypothetical protein
MSLKRSREQEDDDSGDDYDYGVQLLLSEDYEEFSSDFPEGELQAIPGPSDILPSDVENSIIGLPRRQADVENRIHCPMDVDPVDIDTSLHNIEGFRAELKSKVWRPEDLCRGIEIKRIRIPIPKITNSDAINVVYKSDAIEVVSGIIPIPKVKLLKKAGKRNQTPVEDQTELMYIDQSFKGEEETNIHRERFVKLFNACLRPEEFEEKVFKKSKFSYSTLDENVGQINYCIKFMTEVFKKLLRRINERRKNSVMDGPNAYVGGEGLTLHEIITSRPESNQRFPIGLKRIGLGHDVQWDIFHHGGVDMTEEEFNERHYKKKHDYSENYFMVYRPEEVDTVYKCLTDKLNGIRG